jgi:hypothetical protein
MKIQVLWDMTPVTNPVERSCGQGNKPAGPIKGVETGIGRLATTPQRKKRTAPLEFRQNQTCKEEH